MSIALLRARSCEVIGNQWLGADAGAELFLLGVCSMLDAIVDQPMDKAVSGLQLTPGVRDALPGDKNEMRAILDAVISHEQGDWDASASTMQQLGLSAELPAAAYADALRWSRDISSTGRGGLGREASRLAYSHAFGKRASIHPVMSAITCSLP